MVKGSEMERERGLKWESGGKGDTVRSRIYLKARKLLKYEHVEAALREALPEIKRATREVAFSC